MEVIISLLNKVLLLSLVLSILVIIRHSFSFIRNILSSEPVKFKLTIRELVYLGMSVSYVITSIINGIKL